MLVSIRQSITMNTLVRHIPLVLLNTCVASDRAHSIGNSNQFSTQAGVHSLGTSDEFGTRAGVHSLGNSGQFGTSQSELGAHVGGDSKPLFQGQV
jgi:hypothetical protein